MSFQEWLSIHGCKFLDYTADEVVRLAVACGFSTDEISTRLVSIHDLTTEIKNVSELFMQWQYVKMYQNQGTQWEGN